MRLIDADALKEIYTCNFDYENCIYDGATVVGNVDEAPTVDAVPVIRCKDCKYWKETDAIDKYNICVVHAMLTHQGDFCTWAQKGKKNNLL